MPNLYFVLATAESLPDELTGIADTVYINFPWGTLLQGIVFVNELIWQNIKKVCKTNAVVQITLGYNTEHDKKEVDRLSLPVLDEQYIQNVLLPGFKVYGFKTINVKKLISSDVREYPTTWAKKLSFGSHRAYYLIVLKSEQSMGNI